MRGNVAKVEADAAQIAERLMRDATITGLQAEYKVAYSTLMRTIRKHLTEEQITQARNRNLTKGGVSQRFKKGHATWNKGIKGLHFSPETEFKRGHMYGAARRKWRPIGTVVVRYGNREKWKRGRKRKARRWIKVRDDGPYRGRWIPLARFFWQKVHGPIPQGMFVVHADGDSLNDDLSNLRLVDRRGHIALQRRRDPGHKERRCEAAAKATQLRHQTNRALRKLTGPVRVVWECRNCGGDVEQRTCPDRCPKCGSSCYERIKMRATG